VLATAARVRGYALGVAMDSAASPNGGGTSNEEIGDASSSSTLVRIDPGLLARNDPPIDCGRVRAR
jgi:hypothetical protein